MICDTCANYVYDEDWECYTCMVNMDEDDYSRLMSGLKKGGIDLNRKVLADLAVNDAAAFTALCEKAKAAN